MDKEESKSVLSIMEQNASKLRNVLNPHNLSGKLAQIWAIEKDGEYIVLASSNEI